MTSVATNPADIGAEVENAGPDRRNLNLFQIAWNRKPLILLGAACGLALAGLYYAQKAPVYQSTARVLVTKKQADLSVPGMDSKQSSWYYDDYIASQAAVIRSQLIVGRAVEKAGLGRLRSFEGQGNPTGVIIGALTASRDAKDGGGNVLDLTYKGPVSDESDVILMAVIQSYEDFLADTYRNVSNEAADLIKKAEEVLHGKLDQDKKAYKELRLKGPVMVRSAQGGSSTVQQERLVNIEVRQSALLVRQAEIEGRLTAIDAARKAGIDPTPLMDLALDSTRASAADVRANAQVASTTALLPLILQEQKLLETLGKDHPDVLSVRKQIHLTQEFLARGQAESASPAPYRASEREVEAYVRSLKSQLEETRQSSKAMAQLFERENGEARSMTPFELEEDDLRRRIALNEQLYDTILKRLEEIDLVKDRSQGGYEAKILSPAAPGSKVEPKPIPVFGLGLVVGLLAGLGLAFLAEVSDKSFRTPEEIRRRLGLPIVGHIPFLRPDEAGVEKARAQGVEVDPMLCAYLQSKSVQAEAYRGVRTALYFSTQGKAHTVIQITSPSKGDGKSTMAANLAVSIAQSGKSVLILDADFRRPRQHKIFGLPAKLGVVSVMESGAELDDAIQPTAVPNLSVLPCGPRPANPAELLTSLRFEEVLGALRERYDVVLIDTPPLLAVSDPSVVAPRCDGVLLTIRVSKNGRPAAERAKEILTTLGANILGVVVNGVRPRGGDGYAEGPYGAAYGYGYTYESYEAEDGRSYYHEANGSNPDVDLGADPRAAKMNGSGVLRPGSNPDVDLGDDAGATPRTSGDSSVGRRQHGPHRGYNGHSSRRREGLLGWLRGLWS
jgi:capsular exopolysaccharide synthesis family protein